MKCTTFKIGLALMIHIDQISKKNLRKHHRRNKKISEFGFVHPKQLTHSTCINLEGAMYLQQITASMVVAILLIIQ